MSISLIIPAAGIGARFSADVKKQFFEVNGRPVLYYTVRRLMEACRFDEIIIGGDAKDRRAIEKVGSMLDLPLRFVEGGAERSMTVYNCAVAAEGDYLAVHDAVRPFVENDVVRRVVAEARTAGAAICALPVRDTVKSVAHGRVVKTIDRDAIRLAHTPQVFRKDLLITALEAVHRDGVMITDDSQAVEYTGHAVSCVDSNSENIKITVVQDIETVRGLMERYFPDAVEEGS